MLRLRHTKLRDDEGKQGRQATSRAKQPKSNSEGDHKAERFQRGGRPQGCARWTDTSRAKPLQSQVHCNKRRMVA